MYNIIYHNLLFKKNCQPNMALDNFLSWPSHGTVLNPCMPGPSRLLQTRNVFDLLKVISIITYSSLILCTEDECIYNFIKVAYNKLFQINETQIHDKSIKLGNCFETAEQQILTNL